MSEEDIQKEAEKVLKELSEVLGDIDMPETYYVVDDINVTRRSKKATLDKKFIKQAKKNAPKMDEDGSFVMEIGKWVE
jgi:predicted Asp-tRNA(Asn)/Glu-tRNA(Gln) amidotransferase subunit C